MSEMYRINLYRFFVFFVIFGAWEASVQIGWIRPFWVSSPSLILERAYSQIITGELLFHTGVTLSEALSGLGAGVIIGVLLGAALGGSRTLGEVVQPFIMALNALPRVALAPLLILYVGIGFASKFLLAFSLVVVIVMINTFEGIRATDPNLINAMKILGAGRIRLFTMVLLPNSVPWILASIRVSIAFAMVGAIVGEFISSRSGIGYLIDLASGAYDTTGMMVPLFVIMICAVSLDVIVVQITKYLLRWRENRLSA